MARSPLAARYHSTVSSELIVFNRMRFWEVRSSEVEKDRDEKEDRVQGIFGDMDHPLLSWIFSGPFTLLTARCRSSKFGARSSELDTLSSEEENEKEEKHCRGNGDPCGRPT